MSSRAMPSVAGPGGASTHSCAGAGPRGDAHPLLPRRGAAGPRPVPGGRFFLVEGKPMPHVEQRLLVHLLVLENRKYRLSAVEERVSRLIEFGMCKGVDHAAVG